MATVTLEGNPLETAGDLPATGTQCPDFKLVKQDLSEVSLADYAGKRLILNIFPSIDTGTCAASVRRFNEEATKLDNTIVLCVSADLPFAAGRFCGAEGIENVETGSTFRGSFGEDFGVIFKGGVLDGLMSRSVVVVGTDGNVIYSQQVAETVDEPDYAPVLEALA